MNRTVSTEALTSLFLLEYPMLSNGIKNVVRKTFPKTYQRAQEALSRLTDHNLSSFRSFPLSSRYQLCVE